MLEMEKVGEDDPRRVIHSLKVALAITLVSAFYYVKPLYNGFGSSAIWEVFTTILVSEFSVGASVQRSVKGLNRGLATFFAGVLGLGSYCIANSISTGNILEPILLGTMIFTISFGDEYFGTLENGESNKSFVQGYKSVLNSKQAEESLVRRRRNQNYALDLNYSNHNVFINSRSCAYRIDALNGFLNPTK